jgi:hypothetical protein
MGRKALVFNLVIKIGTDRILGGAAPLRQAKETSLDISR